MLVRQEEDRRALSRELHDEIAQVLTAINLQLAFLGKASSRDSAQLKAIIHKSQLLISNSAKTVQDFARRLRPTVLDDLGLVPAIQSYVDDLNESSEISIELITKGRFVDLSEVAKTALFRVIQEAITNVIRHSKATQSKVLLTRKNSTIQAEVRDNGRGIRSNKRGLGMIGMEERMRMIGGTLEFHSTPGKGTQVVASLTKETMHG